MTQDPLDGLAAAREEFDQVVREIQAIAEFRDVHAAPAFDTVAAAAGSGPLVYLTATESSGTALVVRGGDVVPVVLGLTAGDLRTQVHQYFHAYQALRHEPAEPNHERWQVALDGVTQWLWDAAMGPVLDAVGGAAQTTLVACGQFGLLPLHAAWTPDASLPTGRRYVVDATAVSYAAKAQAHQECERRAATIMGRRLLAVVDPNPDGPDALPDTEWEAAAAAARFPEADILRHADADLEAVERLVGNAQILQFGCHGVAMLGTDPAGPCRE
ncbi:CHAT domain-containing protein [Kibdelosporangium banguiense]|uniref:CHAT domain-containing protein n=1 Tax=Kibdelosporangium banguiense TaxID=1365924 RepID=A0ABS4TQA2_9PSEU|nr:CHAT domain-containing protein [Kibdelosporangium banguiense]MBP2326587.1 CHAT domain-containing protein [Kibdelosporangium banguiense]